MKYNELNQEESYVIDKKGTEYPFTGKYNDFYEKGVYTCKNVMLLYINQMINLNQVVDSIVLMMK